jgi:hypothetical protein
MDSLSAQCRVRPTPVLINRRTFVVPPRFQFYPLAAAQVPTVIRRQSRVRASTIPQSRRGSLPAAGTPSCSNTHCGGLSSSRRSPRFFRSVAGGQTDRQTDGSWRCAFGPSRLFCVWSAAGLHGSSRRQKETPWTSGGSQSFRPRGWCGGRTSLPWPSPAASFHSGAFLDDQN